MPLSHSVVLRLAATAIATTSVGFGVNAILRPDHALTFFEFHPPTSVLDKQMVDSLMAIYGVRDIFMGAAIYAASYFGTRSTLGWILIAASGVAFADGFVCWTHGQGHWNHWGYAPMIAVAGSLLLGVFDRL
ncbi:unnamed protein product [Penicillium nalgiovense]|uniref:Integral membrane protein n=1 Tax=Penicillium nalgiovense TaxID=60175 RepID=A0A1V6YYS8_PENNA|nr:hypothetical protein PENNAL_c0007G08922 [Penicillium nalgiovense]CAG8027625.1 unnamed protein product [Penicillium nalgiovense]CAG8078841.1 unnamed protein product [Penicillium nalgiovense]CAG8140980.1 unnamed protein product [Penicillium nalgiovense]CAG8190001.1 unnamed protein product [Penicillium nalgiovense]